MGTTRSDGKDYKPLGDPTTPNPTGTENEPSPAQSLVMGIDGAQVRRAEKSLEDGRQK